MTELDLGLKCGVRRLLWTMGYSTRLDVELRGSRSAGASTRGGPAETFTDLDVLGAFISNESQLVTVIADCKTGRRDKPTARMFWLRGVAEFFGADRAMLVRENDVNDGVRQLAARLRITVLAPDDLQQMQALHVDPQHSDTRSPLEVLFDRKHVADHLASLNGLDRRLNDLLEFLQFDYWTYAQHRNLTQVVAHLRDARKVLDSRNPIHVALVFELCWEYILTVAEAVKHIRSAFLTDPDRGLQEYLFGGRVELREKQEVATALQALAPNGTDTVGYLPDYYGNLRELLVRFLRRPSEVQTVLRYTELAGALTGARQRVTLAEAFGVEFSPVSAKLAADVVGFLTASAELDTGFRREARAYLLAEPIRSSHRAATQPAPGGRAGTAVDPDQPALDMVPPAVRQVPSTESPRTPRRDDHTDNQDGGLPSDNAG